MGAPRKANIDLISSALEKKAMTIPELIRITHLSQPSVLRVVRLLQAEKLIYVAEWHQVDAGAMYRQVAAYRLGGGEDVPKPPTQSVEERRAKNRLYKKRQAERKALAMESARRMSIRKELERPPFRHPQDEWLFGPAPRIWSSAGKVSARIIQQPMSVTDEVEA